jgi:hypothetical protein
MRETSQAGYLMRHRGWWVLRYRERVGVGGKIESVQRAKRLVPVDAEHKTKASVRDLAKRELEPLNRNVGEPLSITKLSDFVDRVYLPFAKQQKRPSTYRGYKQVWSDYLEGRCKSEWLREVKTHHVQLWLEKIAREHEISKTTLSPQWCFSTRGTAGLFRRSKPCKACRSSGICTERGRNQTLLTRRNCGDAQGTLGAARDGRCDCCFHGTPLGRT